MFENAMRFAYDLQEFEKKDNHEKNGNSVGYATMEEEHVYLEVPPKSKTYVRRTQQQTKYSNRK